MIYLSLLALAERPELWQEHHDENLLFTKADFADPGFVDTLQEDQRDWTRACSTR